MIRAGAIGAGMVFGHYARAAAEATGIEIVAVYDADPSRPRTHDSLQRFLDEPLDAVLVLTPNASHSAIVEQCLDRGIATLCEKPLATTAAEAHALLAKADERATLLYTAMHARHRPEVRYFAEHIDAPIERFSQVWLEDWQRGPAWYFDPERSGGGVLLDVGINHIDWISRHLPPLHITSTNAFFDGDVEHECKVTWTFDGGMGTTHVSWRGSPEHRRSSVDTRSGSRFELRHDEHRVVHDGRTHGPWRNDEYARVLRDFARQITHPSTSPAARERSTAAELLALIGRVYERIAAVPERRVS